MTTRSLVAALVVGISIGCGSSNKPADQAAGQQGGAAQAQQGGQQATTGAQQAAQGLTQMAAGLQQMAQGTAKPVEYEQLKALIPEMSGWERKNVKGSQVNMPFAISQGEARYEKDNANIKLEVIDSALNQLILAPFTMYLAAGFSERSDSGYKKAVKVAGHPGFEEWKNDGSEANLHVVVSNRFLVSAEGHRVETMDPVRKLVESIDFAKMAALK